MVSQYDQLMWRLSLLLCLQLPYVMNELTLTELDMGFSIPKVLQASAPTVDHQGGQGKRLLV